MNKKPARVVWFPLGLMLAVTLLLGACGTTDSTSSSQATATPSSSPQSSTSTPPASPAAPPHVLPLTAIHMLDSSNGWALTTSSILKTTNGGLQWKDVTPANAGLNLYAKGQFFNTQDAWVAIGPANQQEGPGIAMLRTTDGGVSWLRSKIDDPFVSLVDVPHFLTAQQGWLALSSTPGAGSAKSDIWYSNDGGQTWTERSSNKSSSGLNLGYVTGISFRDAQSGIAAGNLGAGGDNTVPSVAITHNGGQTWQTKSLPHLLGGYVNPFNTSQPPVFFGNVVILPVTLTGASGPVLVLYRSNDGGLNWLQTAAANIQAADTYVVDLSHAWATDTQTGKLYSTSDGGNHWSLASDTAYQLNALSFTNALNGWGVTSNQLLQTTDGGKTWQQIAYTIQ